jgi:hypothetical protein
LTTCEIIWVFYYWKNFWNQISIDREIRKILIISNNFKIVTSTTFHGGGIFQKFFHPQISHHTAHLLQNLVTHKCKNWLSWVQQIYFGPLFWDIKFFKNSRSWTQNNHQTEFCYNQIYLGSHGTRADQKMPKKWTQSKLGIFYYFFFNYMLYLTRNLVVKEFWNSDTAMKSYENFNFFMPPSKNLSKGLDFSLWIMIQFSNGFRDDILDT